MEVPYLALTIQHINITWYSITQSHTIFIAIMKITTALLIGLAGLGLAAPFDGESNTNMQRRATCPDATTPSTCTGRCKLEYDACVKGVKAVARKKRYAKGGMEYCKLKKICAQGGKFIGGDIVEH
jgi:hypothetical protein